jgi:uncharacterized protein (TIGR02646 family)
VKYIKKSAVAPQVLSDYLTINPLKDWDAFRSKVGRYNKVATNIKFDQRGICAYCEIDFLEKSSKNNVSDFRVEHFHPKSPHTPPPNWGLSWTNLLGTCHGGSQKNVVDATRFSAPNLCCDGPKKDFDWTNDILDPLNDIPAFPPIFKYSASNGEINVDSENCPVGILKKAEGSLSKLKLNLPRLMTMRLQIIEELGDLIESEINQGLTSAQAAEVVSTAMYKESETDNWPAFFSCIRWYLGTAAEERLKTIGYGS